MVFEFWELGESVQDAVRHAGVETDSVEGIAVDLHDILQAADRVREEFVPQLLAASHDDRGAIREALAQLRYELDHIAWHCAAADRYLAEAERQLEG